MSLAPRAITVARPTEYEELLRRHGTRAQLGFFLDQRNDTLDRVDERHQLQQDALRTVAAEIPVDWRRASVDRSDLDRWLFAPGDVIVAVGQDGLVANVAKYLDGQAVLGVNPDPETNTGVLVRHSAASVGEQLTGIVEAGGRARLEHRAMVAATTDDGRMLRALNDLYIGQPTHQSSRYVLRLPDGRWERHSSSGVVVGTGTGASGWSQSLLLERQSALTLPETQSGDLSWFVREAWPSPTTGTGLVEGMITAGARLTITSEVEGLVVFGDGMERDRLELSWGQSVNVNVADQRLCLVV